MLGPSTRTRSRVRSGHEAAAGLAHLDQIGLDHEVARRVVGAAILQRLHLVGRAGDDRLVDALAPGALEIEEHDDAVAEAVGRQDGDVRARLLIGMTSALMAMASAACAGLALGLGRRR